MSKAKIGDKIRIGKAHSLAPFGEIATIVDPNLTAYQASSEDPNVDIDGDYWCELPKDAGTYVCLSADKFEVIQREEKEDGPH